MTDKKLMVSGFDLFYYEITDEQAANIATAIDGKAWEFGDGWCVTKKLDNYMYVPEAEIYFAVRGTTLFGNELATEYGGICDGCELYSGSLGERLLTEVLESKG
jgi:hypothetical protein